MADRLEQNKDEFINYLRQNNWVETDMTESHITANKLSNTNGVRINRLGFAYIGRMDTWGGVTLPFICCTADEFDVRQ